jgi:uncharacterized protein (DUF779 family)
MSLHSRHRGSSDSSDELLHQSAKDIDGDEGMYERVDARMAGLGADVEELELDGSPIYQDDDQFDYPETEKKFGEVVVVMKHIQKGKLVKTSQAKHSRSSSLQKLNIAWNCDIRIDSIV